MNQIFLNNYVGLGSYDATGEGVTQWLRYSHSQENPLDLLADIGDYHKKSVGLIKVKDLIKDELKMIQVAHLSPTLWQILKGNKDVPAGLSVNVTCHQNYS